MRTGVLAAGVTLLGLVGLVAPGALVAFQEPERPPIRIPENLPEPVGEEMRVDAADVDTVLADDNVILLDVREPWELERFGTREGYINIPIGELPDRLDELPRDKMILTA